uniref:Integral membrane protein n=1 Tax=Streptomyces sp. NBC_00003 TaxID=2903608 RepID=A0AAU2V5A2_9ACTN
MNAPVSPELSTSSPSSQFRSSREDPIEQGEPPSACDRSAALTPAVIGAVLVIVAGWLLLSTVPRTLDEERAFAAAPGCPVAEVSTECRHTVAATVTSAAADHKHRSTYYWLGFGHVQDGPGPLSGRLKSGPLRTSSPTRPALAPSRVKMDGRTPVFAAVRPGSGLRLTYWRGEVRYVEFQGLRQYTAADPRGGYRLPLAAALVLLSVGGACLRSAYCWVRRAEPPAHEPWRLTVPLAAVLLISCFAFGTPWVTGGVPTALLLTAVGAVPVLAGAAWLTRRHHRRTTDTIKVTPLAPLGEACFPGTILGEVPYSHEGFGHLVAAPGLLASTPDPAGRFARRPVPRTLTAVRVRPPYWTDPGPRPAPGAQVVECRDGATPVYVVTEQRYTALVLGALRRPAEAQPRVGSGTARR